MIKKSKAIYLNNGVTISPSRTLTLHIGEEGTHFSKSSALKMPVNFLDDNTTSECIELTEDTSRASVAENDVAKYLQLNGHIRFPEVLFFSLLNWLKKNLPKSIVKYIRHLKHKL